ncbi:hypothetical protein BN2476_1050009 [Paraburkholderia piptadeniae]|uniref:Uncharacterized protein n=1 Tax=Paraburkholderia piptadeniae TaxID=1701573 RepID=A0A1N7SUW4_9BURK|nr:hypothetical protein BN2476_1050009 [Paraburkholderia piptadeniae]
MRHTPEHESDDHRAVGGLNSTGQAAVFLARFALHVHVVIRGGGLSASINLAAKLALIQDRWQPRVVAVQDREDRGRLHVARPFGSLRVPDS